jgi:hypothetical protein
MSRKGKKRRRKKKDTLPQRIKHTSDKVYKKINKKKREKKEIKLVKKHKECYLNGFFCLFVIERCLV